MSPTHYAAADGTLWVPNRNLDGGAVTCGFFAPAPCTSCYEPTSTGALVVTATDDEVLAASAYVGAFSGPPGGDDPGPWAVLVYRLHEVVSDRATALQPPPPPVPIRVGDRVRQDHQSVEPVTYEVIAVIDDRARCRRHLNPAKPTPASARFATFPLTDLAVVPPEDLTTGA